MRAAILVILFLGAPAAGYFIYRLTPRTQPQSPSPAQTAKSDGVVRHKALVFAPAGGLKGTVSHQELYRVLLFVQPQWRASKTTNLLHAIRLWGPDARFDEAAMPSTLRTSPPPGERMLEVLLDMKKFSAAGVGPHSFLYRSSHGVQVWHDANAVGGIAHVDQFLKATGELGLSSAQPVQLMDGSSATLGDVVRGSLAVFTPKEELEFTAVAYSRWLPPCARWVDRFGEPHSLDELCRCLLEQPLGTGACSGTHVPYALINLLRAHTLHPVLTEATARNAEERLKEISRLLETHQAPTGTWFDEWHLSNRPKQGKDAGLQTIASLGHHLEWIALAPETLRPNRACIQRAARLLASLVPQHSIETVASTYPPFSHAARALVLLEEADPAEVIRTAPVAVREQKDETLSPER